jgi:acyl carrier protein
MSIRQFAVLLAGAAVATVVAIAFFPAAGPPRAPIGLPEMLPPAEVAAGEVVLPPEGGSSELAIFAEELAELPPGAAVELRVPQLGRAVGRPAPETPNTELVPRFRLEHEDLIGAVDATQPGRSTERIEERVRDIVVEQLEVDRDQVTGEARLHGGDLGADDLDHTELLMALEEAFSLEIPDADAARLFTIGDVTRYISANHEEQSGSSTPGVVDVELWVNGEKRASQPWAIAPWNAQGPLERVVEWRLDAADAAYRGDRFFEVPVRVLAQVKRQGRLVPYRIEEPVEVLVRDLEGNLEARRILLSAGRLMSDPLMVPLRPRTRYRLVAAADGGESSPEVEISWQTHGPDLALKVSPQNQERFAARSDPARLHLFLSLAGSRIRPPEGATLTANPPLGVELDPSPALPDDAGVWRTAAHASGSLSAATIEFEDLEFGLSAAARVHFTYPWLQLLFAVAAGAVGVLVARRKKLFEHGRLAAGLEILMAMVAAGVLYAGLVAGWLVTIPGILGFVPAVALGVLGGYLGDGVFHLLIGRLLPGAKLPGVEPEVISPGGNAAPAP